jgi:fimbrial chaperone protein
MHAFGWGLALLLAGSVSAAAALQVQPLMLRLSAREPVAAVTIHNGEAAEYLLQAEVFRWSQDGQGKDVLSPADDLLVTPPVVTLGRKSQQTLRLGALQGIRPEPSEQSYRLILTRMPNAPAQAGTVALHLQVVLPVLKDAAAPGPQKADFTLSPRRDGTVWLHGHNSGHVHVKLAGMAQNGRKWPLSQYLLPGHSWKIPLEMPFKGHDGITLLTQTCCDGTVVRQPVSMNHGKASP